LHISHLLLALPAASRYDYNIIPAAVYCKFELGERKMASKKTVKSTRLRQMATPRQAVAVVMGSDSDLAIMQTCIDTLKDFGIQPVVRIISAHRTPKAAEQFAHSAVKNGIKVIIAAAGMAAHLAGSIAGWTTLPVIGVPLAAREGLAGLDALLSTVQMPSGVPVATVAIGKAGAKNAAILAAQILALSDKNLAGRFARFKAVQAKEVAKKNAALK
jgi:5-(carboxyamino)imidazole ribonucleotide mutase